MTDPLTRLGLFFDDLNHIRIIQPELAAQTADLRDECVDFTNSMFKSGFWILIIVNNSCFQSLKTLESIKSPKLASRRKPLRKLLSYFFIATNSPNAGIDSFKNISDGFINIIDSLAQEVDKEKMKAIGARNLVKSMAKQREAQEQQLQVRAFSKKSLLLKSIFFLVKKHFQAKISALSPF